MNWEIFAKKHWCQIFFNIVLLVVFIAFYGHFGNIIVDSFREAYIPQQMLSGQVLYKNIFCVYPPLAYLINASIMYVFGASLGVLYAAGFIATIGILNVLYVISNRFLPKLYSLSIVLFIISVSVLSPNVFNYIFPYSYGALYGIFFALLSIYFGLKNKFSLMYLAYIFALCSKYEFIFLIVVLVWLSGIKEFIKNLGTLILIPILIFTPLFMQGLRIEDVINVFQVVLDMSATKTLYWFYSVNGLTFRPELLPVYATNFLKVFIPLIFIYYFRHWTLIILTTVYFWFFISPEIFVYIFPLIIILFLINYKNINCNKKFVILASLLISVKLFFAMTFMSYGVFFVPFAILALYLVLFKRYKKPLLIIILIMSLVFSIKNINLLISKNVKIKSHNTVYANDYYGVSINSLIDFINTNTVQNDEILILPECTAINFLTNKRSDNKFYSLIPLYVETFGEENIIHRLKKYPPKYIVISNYDTSNYYYSYFGQDYAKSVYNYILTNYKPTKQVGKGFVFIIFERKN